MSRWQAALSFALGLLFVQPAFGEPAGPDVEPASVETGEAWILLRIQPSLGRKNQASVEAVRAHMANVFLRADIDGGGFSQSDQDLAQKIARAKRRARELTQWLQRDLDGDGEVTRAELEVFYAVQARRPLRSASISVEPSEAQIAEILGKLVSKALAADTNGDGTITFEEMTEALPGRQNIRPARVILPLELDPDGAGNVSKEEFLAAVDRVLASVDTDTNGTFSAEEIAALKERVGEARRKVRQQQR